MRGVNGKGLVEYSLDEVKAIKKILDEHNIHLSSIGSPIGKIKIEEMCIRDRENTVLYGMM